LYVGSITEAPILDNEEKKKIYYSFILDIIVCEEFKDENLKYCLVSGLSIEELVENISKEKIITLIKNKVILFNKDIYDYIRDNYNFALLHFVEVNKKEFDTMIDQFDFDNIIVYKILSSKEISITLKRKLIKTLNSQNFVCTSDSLAYKMIDIITCSKSLLPLNVETYYSLLEADIEQEYKVKLLINQIDAVTPENLKESLIRAGGEFKKMVTPRGRASFKKNKHNLLFLNILESKKVFSSKKEEKNNIKVYAYGK